MVDRTSSHKWYSDPSICTLRHVNSLPINTHKKKPKKGGRGAEPSQKEKGVYTFMREEMKSWSKFRASRRTEDKSGAWCSAVKPGRQHVREIMAHGERQIRTTHLCLQWVFQGCRRKEGALLVFTRCQALFQHWTTFSRGKELSAGQTPKTKEKWGQGTRLCARALPLTLIGLILSSAIAFQSFIIKT